MKKGKSKKPIKKELAEQQPAEPKLKKLKPGPARFVEEYLKDQNATRAYIAAGYSKNGAGQAAHRMLKIAEVRAAVDAGLARLNAKCSISAKRIKQRIAQIAFNTPYVKTGDILKACELLGRTRGMFKDKVDHNVSAKVAAVDAKEVAEEVKKLEDEV